MPPPAEERCGMTEEIMEMARMLGPVPEHEWEALRPLCQTAELELAGRLKEGIQPEDCQPAFVVAAAWMALAGRNAGQRLGRVASFTAGDLTVKTTEGAEGENILRTQARRLMAPYLADEGFCFRRVRG